MIKKILKYVGWSLLLFIVLLSVLTAFRQHLTYKAPYPAISASQDSTVIARGKHLVLGAAHCVDCHSTASNDSFLSKGLSVPLSGGVKFHLPVGDIYSKNITPDPETGIGKFSDKEIARILRYGVHPDGTAVYDFMPFHNASDDDLTAIISYLRSQKPVENKVPSDNLNLLGNVVKAFLVKPIGPSGKVRSSIQPDTTIAYGQYLALNIADCNGCHTERDLSGKYTGQAFAGGTALKLEAGTFNPPNLTTDSGSRISGWSQANFINRFRMGTLISHSPMPWTSFKNMNNEELIAIYKYLQTVKPVKTVAKPSFVAN